MTLELIELTNRPNLRDLRYPGPPRMQYVESHNDDITEVFVKLPFALGFLNHEARALLCLI